MLSKRSLEAFRSQLAQYGSAQPVVHIVLGSGFGSALDSLPKQDWTALGEFSFGQIPGLASSTVADHPGRYRLMQHQRTQKTVLFQMGRIHGYEGHSPRDTVAPVMVSRLCGVEKFILTNAAGGLDLRMKSGDVMLIEDHINMTGSCSLVGPNPTDFEGKPLGPRFPDMGGTYNPEWRLGLEGELRKEALGVHRGVYLGLLGPTYETHAEVRLFSQWGASAVGMSTVWEAIALKHSGAKLLGLSMISNLGAGLSPDPLRHEDIMAACQQSAKKIINGLTRFLESSAI